MAKIATSRKKAKPNGSTADEIRKAAKELGGRVARSRDVIALLKSKGIQVRSGSPGRKKVGRRRSTKNGAPAKPRFTEEYAVLRRLLKELRQKANLTQAELAKKLAQTPSFVEKCERGERQLDVVQLRAFGAAVEVNLPQADHRRHAEIDGKH